MSSSSSDKATFCTVAEVAQRLQTGPRQVLQMIASGRLRAVNISSGSKQPRWRIHEDAILEFATSCHKTAD